MASPSDNTQPKLDVLEEDDEFDRETEKLQKDGRINCPPKIREILELEPEDKVDFYYAKDADSVKTVYVRKHVGGWFSPMKALKEIGLGAIIVTLLVIPLMAYAQEPTIVPSNQTAPATPTEPTVIAINDLERFRGPNAYVPFVMEMRFPAGVEHIQEVRSISGSSAYTMFDEVNTQPGIVAKRFTTASLDTFTITIGQKYNTPMDQVAEFVIRSGDNAEITWSRTLAIKGLEFQQTFEITTMPVPHIPTAEELNAGVYTRMDQLDNRVSGISGNLKNLNEGLGNTSITLQGFSGVAILVMIFVVIDIALRSADRLINRVSKHNDRQAIAYSAYGTKSSTLSQPKLPPKEDTIEPEKKKHFWRRD